MHAGKWQIFTKDFAQAWVEYPITIASSAITKDLIFYNAIANTQCERNLTAYLLYILPESLQSKTLHFSVSLTHRWWSGVGFLKYMWS